MIPPVHGNGPGRVAPGPGDPGRWLLVILALVPVLYLTLRPAGADSVVPDGLLCVLCGYSGAANLLRNVVLFVPLGAALALLLGPGLRAIVVAVLTTATIESLQFHIPGRNPALIDLLANSLGAALAVGAVRFSRNWTALHDRTAARLSMLWGFSATLVLFGTAALYSVDLPPTPWFVHLDPRLGHLERYDGDVLSASVDGLEVRPGRMADEAVVRESLATGGPVRVRAVKGSAPTRVAGLFLITSGTQQEAFLLGVQGDDLVVRMRYRAEAHGLDRPDLRLREGLRDLRPGTPFEVVFEPRGGSSCLVLDDRRACALGPRMEEGWALLLYPGGLPAVMKRAFDFLWLFFLLVPFGFLARWRAESLVGGGGIVAGLAAGWWLRSVAPASALGLFGAAVGLVVGVLLRRAAGERVRRNQRRHDS